MGKLHRFTGYIWDFRGDFDSIEDLVCCVNDNMRYGGGLKVFEAETADIDDWNDAIDINQSGCTQATYDKYFDEWQTEGGF